MRVNASHSFCASAFGLTWRADLPLTPFDAVATRAYDVDIEHTDRLADRAFPCAVNTGEIYPDGCRVKWRDEMVFDMVGGVRIQYFPGPGWTGELPASLFGTVAALTLAWRGALPLHACAIELDGDAFLIAGRSGSGKSVLTADLLSLGARFVSDDLSVLHIGANGLSIYPGRTTMRLDPALADEIEALERQPVKGDARGKWQLRPLGRTAHQSMPIAGMLLLGESTAPVTPVERPGLLLQQLFRPKWLAAFPNHRTRLAQILRHGGSLPIIRFPAICAATVRDRRQRAADALEAIALIHRP
ncbi:phosphoenolpyruvate carboxykinase (ATP) [Sphingomonas baiyangensis]|uniref:Hpr(Ser) kinase/phosphatase n=1 Tax=Sphingomonas baiyangensis TaxID=2572576 RepID=A0A4U1L4U9_9SPHN|nr:hypothetical protein [Sphingomonas baiyangensis]TKD51574.1 hypothetical protein FBR43_13025 [Sphingomonas baiyangensis]